MIKLKDNSTKEIDTALYQLEQSLTKKIKDNSSSDDTDVSALIEKEATARKAADTTLQKNISTEASEREAADTILSSSIASKQDKLTAGDNITIENNKISATNTTYSVESPVTLNNSTIGLTTVPISKGGTGATTGQEAFENITSGVITSSSPADNEKMMFFSTSWYKTTVLDFWNYIKSKISSVLGLTASSYNGKAANLTNTYYDSGASTSYTISTFLEKLVSLGVISKDTEYAKPFRFSWSYASNGTLSTDYGNITLAGTQMIFLGIYSVDLTTPGENNNNFDITFQCNPASNPVGHAVTLKYTCRSGSQYGPKWTLYNCSRRTVIPTSQPSTLVNGDIWIV